MTPREESLRKLVSDWLCKANDDVRVVNLLSENACGLANTIAFHAQQAVEKYLKAFLTWHQIPFPKTHDIERLLSLIESVDAALAKSLADTSVLTVYGVEIRYPGDRQEASAEEADEAVSLMRKTKEEISVALDSALGKKKDPSPPNLSNP